MEFWVVKYLEIPFGDVSSTTQTDYYKIDIEFLGSVMVTDGPPLPPEEARGNHEVGEEDLS